jgi:hypothetical protein
MGKHKHHNFNFIKTFSPVTKSIKHEIIRSTPRIEKDVGSVLKGVGHTITTITGQVDHSISSTSSSLSLPLAIVGGIVLIYFITKK